nr:DUF4158 domain-containing protein [Bacillus cereus]
MKKNWIEDELLEHFILVDIEHKLIGNKKGASRLGFTVLLKYFQALKAPLDVEPFISDIMQIMKNKLNMLHEGLESGSNTKFVITSKNNKGWLKVIPLDKQVVPPHIPMIKQGIRDCWSNIIFLDLLKETDFHIGFTKHFKTTADRAILSKETV